MHCAMCHAEPGTGWVPKGLFRLHARPERPPGTDLTAEDGLQQTPLFTAPTAHLPLAITKLPQQHVALVNVPMKKTSVVQLLQCLHRTICTITALSI